MNESVIVCSGVRATASENQQQNDKNLFFSYHRLVVGLSDVLTFT